MRYGDHGAKGEPLADLQAACITVSRIFTRLHLKGWRCEVVYSFEKFAEILERAESACSQEGP